MHKEVWTLAVVLLAAVVTLPSVEGHGRLIEPPSRATMWRYGFNTTANYNDHELYCGGYARQWQKNEGKCGICGDPWDMSKPRPHEAGGKYGKGIIVRRYKMDSAFTIRVELTANHKGYFEFRLCPHNAPHRLATQTCLDKHILVQARTKDGRAIGDEPAVQDPTKYYPANGSRVFEMRYLLPKALTCTQCILQWRYFAGNNWGMCPNGTGQVGCGPQEEFRACADVSVLDSSGTADGTPFDNEPEEEEVPPITPDDGSFEAAPTTSWWLLLLTIIFGTFLFIIGSFFFLYCYFFHRERVLDWWNKDNKNPTKVPFWERFKDKELRFWRSNAIHAAKENDFYIPQPIAPPRVKRMPQV